jgi:fructuronate reductase
LSTRPVAAPFLSAGHLHRLPAHVRVPGYDRSAVTTGVVHFGPGAFHRAHQASYFDDLLARDPRFGICAVSLRSGNVRDALAPQDGLYTLAILDEQVDFRVIGAISELLVAAESPQLVFDRLCASQTQLVTSTVTEKGYCLGADGGLDFEHPDVQRDLADPHSPTTLIGYLVEALRRRRDAKVRPFAVICCDNLVDNGRRLRRAVMQLAEAQHDGLAAWIEAEVPFPRTMIDSITPATDDSLRERVRGALGVTDRWPVQREAFLQWVIEHDARARGPEWSSVGVTTTNDVEAYDRAKLRLLNGAHSTLAYLGLLGGRETVTDAMRDTELTAFVRQLMIEDILPTITGANGLDLQRYVEVILQRFRNPTMRHPLAQIAWDGSQKLPFRILGTIRDSLRAGRSIDRLCVPVAAWLHFVRRRAHDEIPIVDPLADRLLSLGRASVGRAASDLPGFLALDTVFPAELAGNASFVSALARAYNRLAVTSAVPAS